MAMIAMRRVAATAAVLVLVGAGCGGGDGGDGVTADGQGSELVGLFRVDPGACSGARATGSWFRMVQPGGTVAQGPFVVNGDSSCEDKTWTLLSPGADGGLRAGTYQPQPDPPFDPSGNARSDKLARPQRWFAVSFALATNPTDPQTGSKVAAPRIVAAGSELTGDLRSLAAAWNGQHFNQGSPKPDGKRPGNTTGPRGTYDSSTRAYTLEWSSQIVGGPFNNFTGVWHLEGTFQPG